MLVSCLVFLGACSSGSGSGSPETHSPENRSELPTPPSLRGLENVTVYPADKQPAASLDLQEAGTIGNTGEVAFGQIADMEVDESGKMFVADGAAGNNTVYIFNTDGSISGQMGRSGRGPGEFASISDIDLYGDSLFVLDRSLQRIQVFSTDPYDFLFTANLDPGQWNQPGEQTFTYPDKIHVLNDSTLLGVFNQLTREMDTRSYYRLDMNGEVTSGKILSHNYVRHIQDPNSSRTFYDLFGGVGKVAFSSDNRIFTAWSQDLSFKVYDAGGSYLYAFHHPFENSPLDRDEALSMYDNQSFNNALKHEGIPDRWRAFEHLVMDDRDRLWVATITDNREVYEWRVMDHSGAVMAVFNWPRSRQILTVANGVIYAVDSSGEPLIKTYRVQWNDL